MPMTNYTLYKITYNVGTDSKIETAYVAGTTLQNALSKFVTDNATAVVLGSVQQGQVSV